jgi:hypothetical protein
MSKLDLKQEMLENADVIIKSVDFLEDLINKKLLAFDKAVARGDVALEESLNTDIRQLLKQLHNEENEMDKYMLKYKKLVDAEKLK